MNLYSEYGSAFNNLFRRYITNKTEKLFYIFPCKIARKNFYAVLSEDEAAKYKIKLQTAEMVIGDTDRHQEMRQDYQTRVNSEQGKKEKLYYQYVNATRREMKLREKLKKLPSEPIEETTNIF